MGAEVSELGRTITAEEAPAWHHARWILRSPMVSLEMESARAIGKHVKSRLIDYDENGDGLCRLCDYTHHTIIPFEWREALRILEAQ